MVWTLCKEMKHGLVERTMEFQVEGESGYASVVWILYKDMKHVLVDG